MTKQHITLAEVKIAAKKAYQEGKLLAQSHLDLYGYEIQGFVCAIGAGLTPETLEQIFEKDIQSDTIAERPDLSGPIEELIIFDEKDRLGLHTLQRAHDRWFGTVVLSEGDSDQADVQNAEAEFVNLLKE